jgi:membrane protein required for colicin V production
MVIDILLLILLVLALYKGWTKGFIMAIFVFVSYFVALALAFHFSGTVEGYMRSHSSGDSKWFSFLSFILVLIAGIIAVRLVGKLIEKSAELMLLGLVNKLLGILVMAIIYTTFFAVTLVYCNRFGLVGDGQTIDSRSASYLMQYGHWLVSHFSEWMPALKNLFNDARGLVKQKP